MLPKVADEYTRIDSTGQTINCRNNLQPSVPVHLGYNCAMAQHKADCIEC